MIELTRIDHINMRVKDLEESKAFYGALFGFEPKEGGVRNGRKWVILGKPGLAYLCLYEVGEAARAQQELQINHFGFHVEAGDFGALAEKLAAKGVKVNYGGAVASGASRSIYIEDPSGYEIELSEKIGGGLN